MPHCRVQSPSVNNVMVGRATLQGVIILSANGHIENCFSPYFIFVVFNAIWALTSVGFRIVFDTLV